MNTALPAKETASAFARASDAWTTFWADHEQSRCAAGAPEIWQALSNRWSSFARSLAHGTRVLDLGCGAGAVGHLIVGARADLHVTGIDAANVPPATHAQVTLRSHTAMEALPFTERRFGAVVSQFGFEYSRTPETAREMARVLAPGAKLSLLVHHAGSAIVAATRARMNAMGALLGPATRTAFCSGDAAGFSARMAAVLEQNPQDDLATQLARGLQPRLASPQAKRIAIWTAIEEALAPERCVSESLMSSCVAPSQLREWLGPLRSVGELMPVTVLREPNGDPIAWEIEGVR
jgi:SAM-dependent methyltransferase